MYFHAINWMLSSPSFVSTEDVCKSLMSVKCKEFLPIVILSKISNLSFWIENYSERIFETATPFCYLLQYLHFSEIICTASVNTKDVGLQRTRVWQFHSMLYRCFPEQITGATKTIYFGDNQSQHITQNISHLWRQWRRDLHKYMLEKYIQYITKSNLSPSMSGLYTATRQILCLLCSRDKDPTKRWEGYWQEEKWGSDCGRGASFNRACGSEFPLFFQ